MSEVISRERIDWAEDGQKRSALHKVWDDVHQEFYRLDLIDPGSGEVRRTDISAAEWLAICEQHGPPHPVFENSDWQGAA